MEATRISSAEGNGAWLVELRAMLALAWPLILANVTQQVIQATDVLLMGRLGATQLAAATLALNLTFSDATGRTAVVRGRVQARTQRYSRPCD